MRKSGLCCQPVSVRPSVCHVRVLYPDGHRYRRTFSRSDSHIIQISRGRQCYPVPPREPTQRGR